ncbi:conserved Plasmodium protein, unknown function [Plasmodium berghei]|uniref:Uncharacterized protein n=2 Tax=Plasmodium berghei TaxID=5821 RepID=A0A509ARL1_PLABA|nr:conserved Plasmodium protein, unknown function [Plasmodium berghei ANKA]CXJ04853.1 conserved Plasmodium protein, unknown function [Plasmodium berghei]SCL98738.1 conserved Plasmodium protein, unknown function [Plasmodium berghei]SCM16887.1 conserved Plasmodium protein, unknown function [Plasmodium berghei]SCM18685.1 conserved Plasmodium protein, unknown function [Plasmodium berghei]SCN28120.1 conserved Plasmodium protein, unknown function [Plasmodium berghei]|eukprot:XP_034423770.1 conserved Plasmodium protein, unknown function [Plasmodium berghei ANKA]
MNFREKVFKKENPKEVVYEGYGKITQEVKTDNREKTSVYEDENNLSKKLPFFMNKNNKDIYNFSLNISENDINVYSLSKYVQTCLNISVPIAIRLTLLYISKQKELLKNYLISIIHMIKGVTVLKVATNGKLKKRTLKFSSYNITILGYWSRKILNYDEITQVNIGSCCTTELSIFEKSCPNYVNRMNYIVIRTSGRSYSFLFFLDDDIVKIIKELSVYNKLSKILKNDKSCLYMNKKKKNFDEKNKNQIESNDNRGVSNTINYMREKLEDFSDSAINLKYFLLSNIKFAHKEIVNVNSKEVKEILKKNNMIYFDTYDFQNKKINSLFLFLQIVLDIYGPDIWLTSKFDEIIFTHLN